MIKKYCGYCGRKTAPPPLTTKKTAEKWTGPPGIHEKWTETPRLAVGETTRIGYGTIYIPNKESGEYGKKGGEYMEFLVDKNTYFFGLDSYLCSDAWFHKNPWSNDWEHSFVHGRIPTKNFGFAHLDKEKRTWTKSETVPVYIKKYENHFELTLQK